MTSKLVPGCKLNLGCGRDIREGWVNVDMHAVFGPDIACDVMKLTPIPDGIASYVLAQDVLEHLPRIQTRQALKEWNRVLAMGGEIEVRVPNVMGVVTLMQRADFDSFEGHQRLIHNLFGTQAGEGDFHFTTFTERTLRAYLADSGFEVVTLTPKHVWLFDVVAKKVRDERPITDIKRPENPRGWVI